MNRFDVPLFDHITLQVFTEREEFLQYRKQHTDEFPFEYEKLDHANGICFFGGTFCLVGIFNKSFNTCFHEVNHAVDRILESVNVPTTVQNTEVKAYLAGFVGKAVVDTVFGKEAIFILEMSDGTLAESPKG